MKQLNLLLIFSLFLFAAPLSAQVMGNYGKQNEQQYQNVIPDAQFRALPRNAILRDDNVLEIGINALSNQRADSYTAIFSVMQLGKTAEETNSLLNSRLDGFLADLLTLGIPKTDIYVDMVNFLPRYEYDVNKKLFSPKTYTEIPKGFELQKTVHIRYTTPGLLDDIVTAAAKQEIYDIIKVDYFINDPNKVYKELRNAAFTYLNEIEATYREIGIELDSAYLSTAENAWVAYPINRYESYQAFSTQLIDQSDKNAIINKADKPVSRFYNAIPANDYDIVLNPEILEPAVQFSYNLVARYTLDPYKPKENTVVKKEFLWLTPEGEVKRLKVE
ncbi:MAG: DUF541 domain-containing protein [Bacteroidetes bacterium]|nr:MAG: DUF541 domain-containing protein [Bacteroidota bacterium]